jgi:CDP-glucose 4,6-dehydratase
VNILITGANGFVGSSIAARLAEDKTNNVVALVKDFNYKTPRPLMDRISVTRGDLQDYDSLCFAMSHYEIDTVYHVGATTILRKSVVDPRTCHLNNTMGTVNVLEAARVAGKDTVKKIIVASSDKAYGTQPKLPYTEDMPMCAEDPYSTSKACTDLIARSYHYTYEMDINVIRSGNIYGPGDLNTSLAHFRREFMYIDDVVDAYLIVAEKGEPGEAYNIGGAGFVSVADTVKTICKVMDTEIQPEIIKKDFIEIKDQYLSAEKLEKLGWECKHDLAKGIALSVPWYENHKNKGGVCNV